MSVVRDDAADVVAWLSCGTPVLRAARADDRAVYTSDQVLDLVIAPERTLVRKDEDELVGPAVL